MEAAALDRTPGKSVGNGQMERQRWFTSPVAGTFRLHGAAQELFLDAVENAKTCACKCFRVLYKPLCVHFYVCTFQMLPV